MQYTPIRYTIDWWNHKTPGKSIMSALDDAFIHFRNGNARKSSKFQRITKRGFQFPQFPFGHFVFISRSEIFAFYFFFFFLRSSCHPQGPCSSSSSSAWPVGRPINQVFFCAHAAAFACADKMEASIGYINMQGPQTQKKVQQGDWKDSRHLHCKVQKTRLHKNVS